MRISLGILLFLLTFISVSQDLSMRRATGSVKIDGILDEPAWAKADSAYDFMQYFPFDTSLAEAQTVARVLYDEDFIYVAAVMYNLPGERSYVTPSLRRDFRGSAHDSFSVTFDPFKDHTNGMLFGINPFGVRREGLISNGDDLSMNWDNKWFGEARQYKGYWIAEMAIPFKTLRYSENQASWYINFYRIDSEYAERSTWSPIPRNFSLVNMATHREMRWDRPTQKPGQNISLIPYVAAGAFRDYGEGGNDDNTLNVGGDVKYAVTPGLNLDITVNPDFSQVEVDRQQTNLSRFELFFPERRQFFLENADLFSDFGSFSARPFFTRRIGVSRDTATGQNIQNRLPFGARLSGKLSDNLRVGLLSMQASPDDENGVPSYNYTVAALQNKVFARSNVGFIFVNKQSFANEEGYDRSDNSRYNRTAGMDFNLASADNSWTGKAYYHRSIHENTTDSAFSTGLWLNYSVPEFSLFGTVQSIGAGYNPEAGFVRRTDIQRASFRANYNYFPEASSIQSHGPVFDVDVTGNQHYGITDWDINFQYQFDFRNTSSFRFRLRREYVYLFSEFDPSGSEGLKLPADTDYSYNMIIASYNSDQRKKFFFDSWTRLGDYFNGGRYSINGSFGYRFQPFGSASIDLNFNRVVLPDPYTTANLFLIGPRFDLTFSKNIFWTTFVQYNSQIENLNINSRLQWRFKPVSDIFLVYTDNYFAYTDTSDRFFEIGQPRTRALVFKFTYWFNL